MTSLRTRIGALVYDVPRFMTSMARRGGWIHMRNRNEETVFDGRGVACHWKYTSDLHIAKVFPSAGERLMAKALQQWPIAFAEAPQPSNTPRVSFVIGHRGRARLPHLL